MNKNTRRFIIFFILISLVISLIFSSMYYNNFNKDEKTVVDKNDKFEDIDINLENDELDFDQEAYEGTIIERGPNKYSGHKILPYNEAKNVQDFNNFYKSLEKAIKNNDKNFLLNVIDESIKYNFTETEDGHIHILYGKDDFINFWDLSENNGPEFLWNELERILNNGGKFIIPYKNTFVAPHFREELINMENELNSNSDEYFEIALALYEKVPVYAEANNNSEVLDYINHEIVDIIGPAQHETEDKVFYYYKILTSNKVVGYIEDIHANTTFDYHLKIEKLDNNWIITEFYPGNIDF